MDEQQWKRKRNAVSGMHRGAAGSPRKELLEMPASGWDMETHGFALAVAPSGPSSSCFKASGRSQDGTACSGAHIRASSCSPLWEMPGPAYAMPFPSAFPKAVSGTISQPNSTMCHVAVGCSSQIPPWLWATWLSLGRNICTTSPLPSGLPGSSLLQGEYKCTRNAATPPFRCGTPGIWPKNSLFITTTA